MTGAKKAKKRIVGGDILIKSWPRKMDDEIDYCFVPVE